ncbi:dnaJ homolog subfamily C member 13-like [Watersipora subatra]|uniref:dnaJ homolog subfamily C member 13-like n=1 Tax=Watersipora subatra TaxID=2589382 RepID=UPI00355B27D4
MMDQESGEIVVKNNQDIVCYFITKHSWRGKYKRVFSVGTAAITTYNPSSLEITNQWPYSEFVKIEPNVKAPANNEFLITMKKGKKTDTMKFSTDHRADILSEALRFQDRFAIKPAAGMRFQASKYHWSEAKVPVSLCVNACSLDQRDSGGRLLCSYDYKDFEGLVVVSDFPGGVCVIHGGFNRLHLFQLQERDQLIKSVMEAAATNIGISIRQRKEPITFEQFQNNRLGKYSTDEAVTSYAEFNVHKHCQRHLDPVRRLLCLTETCVLERDPATYHIATLKPLSEIFSIIRNEDNPQMFSIEYVKGAIRTYTSTERDSLIASVLDGVRASGNRDVYVKMAFTDRGKRLGPFTKAVDEEVESQHLRFIQAPPSNMDFATAVVRFNCNVSYSGLVHAVTADGFFSENKEKLINGTLAALIAKEGNQATIPNSELEMQFHALRRLVASKAGYAAFTKLAGMREKLGLKVVKALKRENDAVTHAAIDMLNALLVPMHDNYELRQEQLNKSSLLASEKFLANLLSKFTTNALRGTGALIISAMLDFMTFSICAPYSETTDGKYFDNFLTMIADQGRPLFKLFQHPSMAIVKGAGLVMKAIIEEGDAEIAAKMQDLALAEGALPRHLLTSMFTNSSDSRALTNRQLSRHLVGLWVTGHPTAMALLKRCMPSGLLTYLESDDEVPEKEKDRMHIRDNVQLATDAFNKGRKNPQWRLIEKQLENVLVHWRARIGMEKKQKDEKPVVLRKRRQRIKSDANWPLFYYHFAKDHAKPNLLWNYKTREELKECLEAEIRAFNVDRELTATMTIAWNHQEFEVPYHCLADEIKIGEYYLRLLLEEDDSESSEETSAIRRSYEFFNDLYHRFLLTPKIEMKCMCIQAMTIVYGRCFEEIGAFNDTKYIMGMLERSTDKLERDRLLQFLNRLIQNKKNVKELLDANGVRVLVDLLPMAHLHTTRATVPLQTNVIEASADMKRESEKEWYYGNRDKERLGPFGFDEIKELYQDGGSIHAKTRCWAQGMDGWRPMYTIPQLKWCLLATSQSVMNETDLSILILNMLNRILEYYPSKDSDGAVIRPLPRAQRLLSEPICLPHIVQLLVTFDPVIVEKVAKMLYLIMQDNPGLSRLYLTGTFFFILMYTGSNVLPIARFLKYAHMKQAFRSEESNTSDIMQRSILGHMLPEAMICYLEQYEPEKFSEIFLGEFDTPEAIWNAEMRRLMIEKIASHLGDFSPRLQSNTRAMYQYCPIPVIVYPALEHELFCGVYYLKHLCNTEKFPDWPIREPVQLLKQVLKAWKEEVEKKPPEMSTEEAYKTLGLATGAGGHEESKVRKAYFRMAQKYHPDKNPEGRPIFEKANKAYEFLCTRDTLKDGPDPQNIVLILKTQSILFTRYQEVLEPYKYAGYPMLIKTIELETNDDQLFSKAAPLLSAASELAFHTMDCSALNAEELRREKGIQTLHNAFSRCISTLSTMSKPDDLAVQVCSQIAKCYGVASQFQKCREVIQEIPVIVKELSRILYYKTMTRLCSTVTQTVSSFCVDYCLQTALYQCGVLWHLLLFFFNYDYTLQESGVDTQEATNQQHVSNQLACNAVTACAALGGYRDPCPENPAVKASLSALLTPYLAKKLSSADPTEVLKVLNSNTENPYLLWDNATRQELTEYLTDQQTKIMKTGECDQDFGASFVSTVHAKELIVGEIYVRVYNEQPTFVIENPKGFTIDLLEFLSSNAQYLHSVLQLQAANPKTQLTPEALLKITHVQMALTALYNVIKNNPGGESGSSGVEMQCIGNFKLLFYFLRLPLSKEVQDAALKVISLVTTNQECVNDIAASEVLSSLLVVIPSLPKSTQLILQTLHALISNTKIVKELMLRGGVLYLLDLFCNNTNPAVREQAGELFAKMLNDKLVGPRCRIILSKFLPPIFMDAMRDSTEASVHMFEGVHENPELIWNDEAREKVCDTVRKMTKHFHREQKAKPDHRFTLPEDFAVVYTESAGEMVVGGVFLRLFIANPTWVLRKPKEFLVELLEKWCALTSTNSPNGEHLETVTTALVFLFKSQPILLESVPQLGHIPKILKAMTARNEAFPKHAIQIVHQLSNSEACVRSLSGQDSIGPIIAGMKARPDTTGIACEALNNLFSKAQEELVSQALQYDLIPYLLSLLRGHLEGVDSQAAVKAQIVKALKAMLLSLEFGERVRSILEESTVWNEYKDQRHDLFISSAPIAGYLTGGAPNVAGYLTSSSNSSNVMPNAPPPIATDSHDPDNLF